MSTPEQSHAAAANGEELFVRTALANVERAERFQRIKQIVLIVISLPAAYYLMENPRAHPTFTVVGVLGLALAVCTVKIRAQLTANTRAILQAIAALPQK